MQHRSLPTEQRRSQWTDMRDGRSPLAGVVESFLLDRADLSDRTRTNYAIQLRDFAQWVERRTRRPAKVADVSPDTVNDFVRHREHHGERKPEGSRHQARNACVALKSLAKFLAVRGIWHDTGASALRHVRIPQSDVVRRHLQDDEARRVVAAAAGGPQGRRDRTLAVLLLGTGLRLKEVANLKLADLDLAEGVLLVRAEGTKGRPGRRREREVTLPPEVIRELDRYLRDVRKGRLDPEALVFTDRTGSPLTHSGIAQIFRRLKRWTGIDALSVHALRTPGPALPPCRLGRPLRPPGGRRWSDLRMVRRYATGRPREERRRAPSPLSGLLDRPTGRRSSPQVAALRTLRSA
ncbi:MAG: hypothetical protein E6H88_16265 [Chloroflexi bacterium]|nr:MAG: hypothetical protein E6H88_16265 [Chloroflexota bacterium]